MGANGAWFGPGALVNSACASCANALFGETNDGKAFIKLRCCVSKGDQILVPYQQKRASACIKCRVPLGDARSMEIDEAVETLEGPLDAACVARRLLVDALARVRDSDATSDALDEVGLLEALRTTTRCDAR